MKKIVNIFILIVVCFLPIMVNGKTSVDYEWKLENQIILSGENGNYYYLNFDPFEINKYSKEGEKLESRDFSRMFYSFTFHELYSEKALNTIFGLNNGPFHYNSELDEYYSIRYFEKTFMIYDKTRDIDFFTSYSFDNDLNFTKKVIGYEYNVYEKAYNSGLNVQAIFKEEGYYLVYGYDNNDIYTLRIYDSNLNVVLEIENDTTYKSFLFHLDNGKIYGCYENTVLEVYDLTGKLLDSFVLGEEVVDSLDEYQNYDFEFFNFAITNNNVVVSYALYNNDPVLDNPTGYNDLVKAGVQALPLSFKFRLKYEVDTPIENWKVNFENKIDENDREYVELDIVPEPGYSIGKITVTDSTGAEIEVTDSKFYMPNSDVKVDVLFIKGEYLPIPDTFLGKSVTVVVIGLILIGLGFYTINYVREEEK